MENGNTLLGSLVTEEWVAIPNLNYKYYVSNLGRIKSFARGYPYIIKQTTTRYGYFRITIYLRERNIAKSLLVHRLVANSFVSNVDNLPIVMHKDHDKKNNNFNNLIWGTSRQNNIDSIISGGNVFAKGVQRRKSNLTEKDVLNIFNSIGTCAKLAAKYSVNSTCISDIRSGRSWNHITGLLCTRKIKPKFSKDIKFVND